MSVFNLKAFSMYLAKGKIDWDGQESSTYKYLLMLAEMSQKQEQKQ